jgi:hypothetical protein
MLETLRLEDLSDREVLLVIADLAGEDADGWVLAYDVGERLGIAETKRKRAASSRMSWLRRYGALEREYLTTEHGEIKYDTKGNPRWGQRWRLTVAGHEIAMGNLRAGQHKAVDGMTDGQLLLLTRALADRARYAESSTAAKLAEREWKHQWTRAERMA